MVVFEVCNSTTSAVECAEDSEIEAWMKGRYIIILENQKKFISHKFKDESF